MENGQPPVDGKEALVDHFLPEYPGMSRADLKSKILGNPEVFERSLRLYYQDSGYARDRDFYTFKQQFTKKYGYPGQELLPEPDLETPEASAPEGDVWSVYAKILGGPDLSKEGQEAVKRKALAEAQSKGEEIPLLKPGELEASLAGLPERPSEWADRTPPPGFQFDPVAFRQQMEKDALDHIRKRRKGDYETPADEKGLSLEGENFANVERRMGRRTPFERFYLGTKKGEETVSSYKQRMAYIGDEIGALQNGIQALDRQIEEKYGKEVWERIKIDTEETAPLRQTLGTDELFRERQSLAGLLDKNVKRGAELLKDPDFKNVALYLAEQQTRQAARDIIEERGLTSVPGLSSLPIAGTVTRAISSNVLPMISTLMDIGEEAVGEDKKYTGWDLMEDFFTDVNSEVQSIWFPSPSAAQRGITTRQAEIKIGGQDLVVDFDGDTPTTLRTKKGSKVPVEIQDLPESEQKRIKALKPSRGFNKKAFAYQAGETVTQLALQVMATRGLGGSLVRAGMPAAAAETTALTGVTAGQSISSVYEKMKEAFGDGDKAAAAAVMASVGIGLSANMFGLEKQLASLGSPYLGKLSDKAFAGLSKKVVAGMSPGEAARKFTTGFLKAGLGEAFEETVLERMAEDTVRVLFGAPVAEYNAEEFLNTGIMSFAVGALGGGITSKADLNKVQKDALYQISKDPNRYESTLRGLIDRGAVKLPEGVDQELFIANQQQMAAAINKQMQAVEEFLPPDVDRGELANLLGDRYKVKVRLEQIKAVEGSERMQAQLQQEYDYYSKAVEKMARAGTLPEVIGPPKPTPERKFIPEPEPPSEPGIPLKGQVGQVVSYKGRLALITEEDGTFRLRGKDGRVIRNLGKQGDVSIGEFNLALRPDKTIELPGQKPVEAPPQLSKEPAPIVQEAPVEAPVEPVQEEAALEETEPLLAEEGLLEGERSVAEALEPEFAEMPQPEIGEEEVDFFQEAEAQLEVALGIAENDFENRPAQDFENFVAGINHPEAKAALRNFRNLPEHPRNRPAEVANQEALDEAFEQHKRNFVQELSDWSGLGPLEAREAELAGSYEETEADAVLEEAAQEYEKAGDKQAAQELRALKGKPPQGEENYQEELDIALEAEEDVPSFEEMMSLFEETERELGNNWEEMTDEQLQTKQLEFSTQIGKARGELAKAQENAQQEAMDMQALFIEEDVAVSSYIKEATAPHREALRALEAQAKAIRKILEERRSTVKHREEVQAQVDKGNQEGFADTTLGFAFSPFSKLSSFLERAWEIITKPGGLSEFLTDVLPEFKEVEGQRIPIRKYVKDALTITGKVGNYTLWDVNQQRINRIKEMEAKAKFIDTRFRNAVTSAYGKATPQLAKALDSALKDPRLLAGLPIDINGEPIDTEVRAALEEMRSLIDNLSKQLIRSGVTDGEIITVIDNNLGTYVTRHYRAHFDPKWKELVTRDKSDGTTYAKARAFFMESLEEELVREGAKLTQAREYRDLAQSRGDIAVEAFWAKRVTDLEAKVAENQNSRDNIDAYMEAVLETHTSYLTGTAGAKSGKLGSKKLGIFKERAGSLRAPQRRAVEQKIKAREKAIAKARARAARLTKAIERVEAKNRPAPMKLRDKKVSLQRQNTNLKGKTKTLEKKLATAEDQLKALPEGAPSRQKKKLARGVEALKAKIARNKTAVSQNEGFIQDINAQIEFEKNVPYSTKRLKELRDNAFARIQSNAAEINNLLLELDEIGKLDLDPRYRAFLGEVEDPSLNFITTIHKQAHLVANHEFLDQLARPASEGGGLGVFLFETPVIVGNRSYTSQISAEGSQVMSPLNGFYTTSEINTLMENYNRSAHAGGILNAFALVASKVKFNLTVLYHMVGLRNLFSASYAFTAQQGDFSLAMAATINWMFGDGNAIGILSRLMGAGKGLNKDRTARTPHFAERWSDRLNTVQSAEDTNVVTKYMAAALNAILNTVAPSSQTIKDIAKARQMTFGEDVWGIGNQQLQAEYTQAAGLGLFDEDFTYRAYQDAVKAYRSGDLPQDIPPPLVPQSPGEKQGGWIWAKKKATKAVEVIYEKSVARYRSSDNAGRLFRFYIERSKYSKAYFGKPYHELTIGEQDFIDRQAAEIAKRVYPTMTRVPPAVQAISRFPFFGDFVSFPAANLMVYKNSIMQGVKEVSDPRLAHIGLQRFLGTFGSAALTIAAVKTLTSTLGWYDDEDEDRLRELVPDWSKDSEIMAYPALNEKGEVDPSQFYYIDLGPQLPITTFSRIVSVGASLATGQEGAYRSKGREFSNALGGVLSQFVQTGIAYERFLEAFYNTKKLGEDRPIVPNSYTTLEHLQGRGAHLFKPGGFVPGTFGMAKRGYEAVAGIPSAYGTLYNPQHEALAWLIGTRVSKIDVTQSLVFKHKGLASSIDELNREWYREINKGKVKGLDDKEFWKSTEITKAREQIQSAYDRLMKEAILYNRVAEEQGLDDKTRRSIYERRYNKKELRAIESGVPVEYDFTVKGRTAAPPLR